MSAVYNGHEKSPAAKTRRLEDKIRKRRVRENRAQQQDNAQIEQCLDALWLERNLVENTLVSYQLDLQAFLAERVDSGYNNINSARLLSAMRRLFQYLDREKLCADDPITLLASQKLPPLLPKDLSEAQIDVFLKAFCVDRPIELRDKAMLEVLHVTGLQVLELVGLTISYVRPAAGRGTGDRQR